MVGRLPAAMRCLSFLLVTAAPLHALAQDERPIPPLPIGPRQTTAADHARVLSKMADTAARNSAICNRLVPHSARRLIKNAGRC